MDGVSAGEVPERFAVAFSLAGEQRPLVLQVAQEVEAILGRATVFYDLWYEHYTAGSDADLLLQGLYREKSELVVVCVSDAYGDKPWTQTEHRAIRARSMHAVTADDRRCILPLRVGDGEVEGLLFNEIVPDVRSRTAAETAELIIARLHLVRGSTPVGALGPSGWPSDPPDLTWPMADHGEARAAFAQLLSDPIRARALLIRGASETGKSHISNQMILNAMELPRVVACGRWGSAPRQFSPAGSGWSCSASATTPTGTRTTRPGACMRPRQRPATSPPCWRAPHRAANDVSRVPGGVTDRSAAACPTLGCRDERSREELVAATTVGRPSVSTRRAGGVRTSSYPSLTAAAS
jgi:hypothetical protein